MHTHLSTGSAVLHSVLALLETSSPPPKNVWGMHNAVTFPSGLISLYVEMSAVLNHFLCSSSFADTDPLCNSALFTHHIAAPVKLAVAAFAPRLLQDVMASAAAQTLAVVHARAGLVADAPLRARRVRPQVPLAKIR